MVARATPGANLPLASRCSRSGVVFPSTAAAISSSGPKAALPLACGPGCEPMAERATAVQVKQLKDDCCGMGDTVDGVGRQQKGRHRGMSPSACGVGAYCNCARASISWLKRRSPGSSLLACSSALRASVSRLSLAPFFCIWLMRMKAKLNSTRTLPGKVVRA